MSREVFLYEEQYYIEEKKCYTEEEKRYTKADSEIYLALQALAGEEEEGGARYYLEDQILDKRQKDDYRLVGRKDRGGGQWVKSKFVGFIYYKDKILVSLPKYVSEEAEEVERLRIYQDLCALLYQYRGVFTDWLVTSSDFQDMTRELQAAEKLGELYRRNGLYTVPRSSYNTVSGRVLWGRTVAKQTPVLCDGTPIYFRTERRKRCGEENEISEVQKALLYFLFEERGYRFLLPGYPAMKKGGFSWEQVQEKVDFYRSRLRNERQMVFDDDRIDLLETMLEFLDSPAGNGRGGREGRCAVYGVAHFEDLFERLLGECLNNQIEVQKAAREGVSGKITRVSFVSKLLGRKIEDINADSCEIITWNYDGHQSKRSNRPKYAVDWNRDISVPDVVYELPEAGVCMLIDAKYYRIHADDREMYGYPGRDSVLKQIHYKRILEKLYRKVSPQPEIYNLFLLPDGGAEESGPLFIKVGEVKYPGENILLIHVNMARLVREALKGTLENPRFQEELWREAVKPEKEPSNE